MQNERHDDSKENLDAQIKNLLAFNFIKQGIIANSYDTPLTIHIHSRCSGLKSLKVGFAQPYLNFDVEIYGKELTDEFLSWLNECEFKINYLYYLDNKFNRDNGPAIEWADGTNEWWINGVKTSEAIFWDLRNMETGKKPVLYRYGKGYYFPTSK